MSDKRIIPGFSYPAEQTSPAAVPLSDVGFDNAAITDEPVDVLSPQRQTGCALPLNDDSIPQAVPSPPIAAARPAPISHLRTRLEEAEADLTGVRAELEDSRVEREGLKEELETARAQMVVLQDEMEGMQMELRELREYKERSIVNARTTIAPHPPRSPTPERHPPQPWAARRIAELEQENAELFGDKYRLLRRNVEMQKTLDEAFTASQASQAERDAQQEGMVRGLLVEHERVVEDLKRERQLAVAEAGRMRQEIAVVTQDLEFAQQEVARLRGMLDDDVAEAQRRAERAREAEAAALSTLVCCYSYVCGGAHHVSAEQRRPGIHFIV